jgi:hypothetical protein
MSLHPQNSGMWLKPANQTLSWDSVFLRAWGRRCEPFSPCPPKETVPEVLLLRLPGSCPSQVPVGQVLLQFKESSSFLSLNFFLALARINCWSVPPKNCSWDGKWYQDEGCRQEALGEPGNLG